MKPPNMKKNRSEQSPIFALVDEGVKFSSESEERRGWVRRLAVLVTILGLGVLLAPSAVAGGQTSVLVTSPSSGEASALYVSDPRFGRLSRLLGPPDKGDRLRPPSLDGSVATRQINVTWMALDLQPTRTDRVFPGADPDTVWIHTAAQVPATYRGLWHRAAEPSEKRFTGNGKRRKRPICVEGIGGVEW